MERKYNDLEERSLQFSLGIRDFCYLCKKDIINIEYIKQLVRSAGSTGANYIEANDSLGQNDKKMRIRISKKEAKESVYWLQHISTFNVQEIEEERIRLLSEAKELMLILAAILRKLE